MNFALGTHMPSYLHNATKVSSKYTHMRSLPSCLLIMCTLALTGCSHLPVSKQNASQERPTSASTDNPSKSNITNKDNATSTSKDTENKPPKAIKDTTTQINDKYLKAILEAEFTLQREGTEKAFGPFYKLTEQTKNTALAKHLLRIATATQNEQDIEKSANLVMSIAPHDQQAYALKFQVLAQSQRSNDAATLLESAIKHHVKLDFLPIYADENIRSNEIMGTLSDTLVLLPAQIKRNEFIQATKARLLFSQGHYTESAALTKTLIAAHNNLHKAPIYLILAYSQDQLGSRNKAIQTLEKGFANYPNEPQIITPLLNFLVQANQLKESKHVYQTAKLSPLEQIQAGIRYSNTLLTNKHPELALETLNHLPANHYGLQDQILYLKATALYQTGKKKAAIQSMQHVKGALLNSATNQMALWMYNEGREKDINKMVLDRTPPQYISDVVTTISQLHEEEHHPDLSWQLLTEALKKYPQSNALRYHKALLAENMNHWQDTIKELKVLLSKDPKNPQYLNALGYTLLTRTQDTKQAMNYIQQAYKYDPKDPAIVDSLGWGYFMLGKLKQATYYLNQAWQLYPDSDIAAHLGESLWQQKNYSQADSIWHQALQIRQSSPLLMDTIKRLNPSLIEKHATPQQKESTQ
ncbi:tetratricopeptide repeat protein [Marinomonas spartinae]|uniref:Tetratricopeptide repeat protein n=2 Tax=Marinomonas spartinae TaxID=1792290 RepID=A0A1A8TJF9_9GAMM|nr:tetratricopeptide repeat protein [Marinomonas spartinae]